jgi:DNA end-binding protein Ku
METLFHPDEVREAPDVSQSRVNVSKQEMEMATHLVDLLSKPFDPADYADHYREALMKVIEAKQEGEEITSAPPPAGKVVDLMSALKASVDAARSSKDGRKPNAERKEPARVEDARTRKAQREKAPARRKKAS